MVSDHSLPLLKTFLNEKGGNPGDLLKQNRETSELEVLLLGIGCFSGLEIFTVLVEDLFFVNSTILNVCGAVFLDGP